MINGIKKIWDVLTTVLVVVVIILAVLLVGARIFGLQVFTVLSGSMEPTFQTGSLIYVKPVEASEVKVGEPISYVLNESLTVATHRVIEIDADKQHFYTKGDANNAADGAPVHFNNLIGIPIYTIPYLGYVESFIRKPPGIYLTIAGAALLLLLAFLPDLLDDNKDKVHEGNDLH